MKDLSISILLVEDNPGDARLIKAMLPDSGTLRYSIVWVDRMSNVTDHVSSKKFDVVLLGSVDI